MELSIIMINYNTPELTAQAVESILKTTHQVSYEILVICLLYTSPSPRD